MTEIRKSDFIKPWSQKTLQKSGLHGGLHGLCIIIVGLIDSLNAMTEEKTQPSVGISKRRIIRVLLASSAVFACYVFSMGPAYRLLRKDMIQQRTFSCAYWPIVHLAVRYGTVEKVLQWYLDFWYDEAKESFRLFQKMTTENK